MQSFRAVRFAVPFSKDSYSYSLWGRPGTPPLRSARSPRAQNPVIDTLTAPARAFWIFLKKLSFTLLPFLISLTKSHLKEPKEGKERGPGGDSLGMERGIETFSPPFHSYSQVFGKCGQKKSQWNGFKDRDADEGQVQCAGGGAGGAGECLSMCMHCLKFISLGFFP